MAGSSNARVSASFSGFRAVSLKRSLVLGLCAAALIVHLLWRIDTTLAGLDATGVALSIALLAIQAFVAATLIVAALADLLPAAIEIEPQTVPEFELPTVDIFVLIADPRQAPKAAYSLAVASQIDYPRELVNLSLVGHGRAGDDAQSLMALAARTRANWMSASAGVPAGTATNAAMARTAGSLVIVLNAGEAPTPDLLRRIVGGFAVNPRLAFCDVPVFSIDGDPMLTDIDVTQRMPGDPGHFFKSCLKSAGSASSVLGLGLVTVWRRAALSASGSLSRSNFRPDAIARIRAAEHRWQRAIVTRPMIAALAPDTVRLYLQQRLAQRLGTIDAAMTRDPLMTPGMPLRERLSWAPALFSALTPFAWLAVFAIPPLSILLRIPLVAGTGIVEGAATSAITLAIALLMAGLLHTGIRSSLVATWSEILESLLCLPSLVRLLRGKQAGNALPDPENASGTLVVLFALLLAGTTVAVAAWMLRPDLHETFAAATAMTLICACLFACLLGAIAEPRQRRQSPRVSRRIEAELLLGGETFAGRLADISVHGARFIADELVDLPARAISGVITLKGRSGRSVLPVQLSRQSEQSGRSAFGLSFTGRTVGEFATVVRLAHRSGDAYADLCDSRARPAGLVRMVASLSLRGMIDFVRKLVFARKPDPELVALKRQLKRELPAK